MEIVLQAFGKLRSEPISVSKTLQDKTTFELVQPQPTTNESEAPPFHPPIIKAEFVWMGQFTTIAGKSLPLFELSNIRKAWEV